MDLAGLRWFTRRREMKQLAHLSILSIIPTTMSQTGDGAPARDQPDLKNAVLNLEDRPTDRQSVMDVDPPNLTSTDLPAQPVIKSDLADSQRPDGSSSNGGIQIYGPATTPAQQSSTGKIPPA